MLTPEQVFALIPQQRPFRFIDRLVELTEMTAVGEYTFRADESFYEGHFPGNPVTPGVILIEAMCQTGVVALGIHLLGMEVSEEEVAKRVTLFTDAHVEFARVVLPETTIRVTAEVMFWRRSKIKSKVELTLADGTYVAGGTVSGMGVPREQS
ncbi:MAG TPA: beta-hydroxyacyl-ACP dehydratase [Candidatus Handelsmanbacteria bacterium]|nr:beta-hydroxyacyl-ACP dehydratase [Candidatus Handelsmanbacteria bacterium]